MQRISTLVTPVFSSLYFYFSQCEELISDSLYILKITKGEWIKLNSEHIMEHSLNRRQRRSLLNCIHYLYLMLKSLHHKQTIVLFYFLPHLSLCIRQVYILLTACTYKLFYLYKLSLISIHFSTYLFTILIYQTCAELKKLQK